MVDEIKNVIDDLTALRKEDLRTYWTLLSKFGSNAPENEILTVKPTIRSILETTKVTLDNATLLDMKEISKYLDKITMDALEELEKASVVKGKEKSPNIVRPAEGRPRGHVAKILLLEDTILSTQDDESSDTDNLNELKVFKIELTNVNADECKIHGEKKEETKNPEEGNEEEKTKHVSRKDHRRREKDAKTRTPDGGNDSAKRKNCDLPDLGGGGDVEWCRQEELKKRKLKSQKEMENHKKVQQGKEAGRGKAPDNQSDRQLQNALGKQKGTENKNAKTKKTHRSREVSGSVDEEGMRKVSKNLFGTNMHVPSSTQGSLFFGGKQKRDEGKCGQGPEKGENSTSETKRNSKIVQGHVDKYRLSEGLAFYQDLIQSERIKVVRRANEETGRNRFEQGKAQKKEDTQRQAETQKEASNQNVPENRKEFQKELVNYEQFVKEAKVQEHFEGRKEDKKQFGNEIDPRKYSASEGSQSTENSRNLDRKEELTREGNCGKTSLGSEESKRQGNSNAQNQKTKETGMELRREYPAKARKEETGYEKHPSLKRKLASGEEKQAKVRRAERRSGEAVGSEGPPRKDIDAEDANIPKGADELKSAGGGNELKSAQDGEHSFKDGPVENELDKNLAKDTKPKVSSEEVAKREIVKDDALGTKNKFQSGANRFDLGDWNDDAWESD